MFLNDTKLIIKSACRPMRQPIALFLLMSGQSKEI